VNRDEIRAALDDAPVGALCDRDALALHLAERLGAGDAAGPREYATLVRSTVDGREPLVLPVPGKDPSKAHAQAQAQATTINADPGDSEATVVWRPAGGWRPVDGPE
jgi:hypothetical protein